MIIWINGSFGSGKTSVAKRLYEKLGDAFLFDPEEVGFFIRDNIPSSMQKNDFQEFPLWRSMNYDMISTMETNYKGILIIAMTLVNDQYYDEIIGQLRSDGHDVNHYSLQATKETLLKRLELRGDKDNPWILERIDTCIKKLSEDKYGKEIKIDAMSIEEISDHIIKDLRLR